MTEYKIGVISKAIATAAKITAGIITINDAELKHIVNRHHNELEKLGITAIDFTRFVAENYNQIRKAKDGALYLVVYNSKMPKIAVIKFKQERKHYTTLTATPMSSKFIERRELIWEK